MKAKIPHLDSALDERCKLSPQKWRMRDLTMFAMSSTCSYYCTHNRSNMCTDKNSFTLYLHTPLCLTAKASLKSKKECRFLSKHCTCKEEISRHLPSGMLYFCTLLGIWDNTISMIPTFALYSCSKWCKLRDYLKFPFKMCTPSDII